MMLFQSLESRTFFSNVGLDQSFGVQGRVEVVESTLTDAGSTLAIDGAIFVEIEVGKEPFLYKLDDAGNLVKDWGNGGRVALPFDATKLVYDWRSGSVMAAGVVRETNDDIPPTVNVLRLTREGVPDPQFGINGLATYTPGRANDSDEMTVVVGPVVAQPHGALLMGLHITTIHHGDPTGYSGIQEAHLLQLRGNGQRDATFGRRGIKTIASGEIHSFNDSVNLSASSNNPIIADILPLAGGRHRVVIQRHAIERTNDPALEAKRSSDSVEARTVDATGQIDLSQDARWTISKASSAQGTDEPLATYFIAAMNDRDVRLIGEVAGAITPSVFDLVPGKKLARTEITGNWPVVVNHAFRSGRHLFVGFGEDVYRLRPDFTLDRRWGERGLATADSNDLGFAFHPDTAGRVIGVNGGTLVRLDGSPAERNTTPGSAQLIRGDVLSILGTSADDVIDLRRDESRGQIVVSISGKPAGRFKYNMLDRVIVDTGAGDDRINESGAGEPTLIVAGRGNDVIRLSDTRDSYLMMTVAGGDGDDIVDLLTPDRISSDGGAGTDLLRGTPGAGWSNFERVLKAKVPD